MKFILNTSIFLIVFCTSCELVSNEPNHGALVGKWEWVRSTGGIGGITYTPATTGYTRTLILNDDLSFKILMNGELQNKGHYMLNSEKEGVKITYVIPQENYFPEQFVSFQSHDTLLLRDHCMDCFNTIYVKKK